MILALAQISGYRNQSDGRFPTAKVLVPRCLDACELITIRRFFQKTWRYIDAYKKGLDARQAASAIKKYKSHRKISLPAEFIPKSNDC
jgi:hypothetical protein